MDFIESMVALTKGLPTTDVFRLWTAIATVGGALERRVWSETAQTTLFPNMFILLVGGPGAGKSIALSEARSLWRKSERLGVAPNDTSAAALVDALKESSRDVLLPDKSLFQFHSLLVASSEFGVLLPEYDGTMLALLCDLYDNPDNFEQRRRTKNLVINIEKPHINILAGCTPAYLASTFPETAWSTGFSSRTLMIYSDEKVKVPLFTGVKRDKSAFLDLGIALERILNLNGEFTWTDDAMGMMELWDATDCGPVPGHSKLQTYNQRRALNAMKLAMISSASRRSDLIVDSDDFTRAQDWLLSAERAMPDIFRDMVHKSDADVLRDLHFFMWQKWIKDKEVIPESGLYYYLSTKVPSTMIPRIIEAAERSGMIMKDFGAGGFVPRPQHEHGEIG